MRKVTVGFVFTALVVFTTCITEDTTAPQISIVSPGDNDTIAAGNILLKAYATDNKGVTRVEFYIDNTLKGTDQAGAADTFRYTWDASAETPGSVHRISAKAYDAANNTATSGEITIVIAGGGGGTGPTHHSGSITQDETWYPSGNPHLIDGDVSVENNATLTIKPGCIVKFAMGTELYAGYYGTPGAIIANGTPDSTILFTSSAAAPAPGDWQNVGLYGNAMTTSSFAYCTFEYGGGSNSYPGEFYAQEIAQVKISHCTFRHSGNYGVYMSHNAGFHTFTDNTITTCAEFPLYFRNAEYVRTLGSGNSFTGNTLDGIKVYGGTVVTSGTWINPGVPYIIENDVAVESDNFNPVLTIAPGTTIKFQPDVEFYCGYRGRGAIKADGTAGRITFTSSSPAPNNGDWQNIGFYQYALNDSCKLINCNLTYGGGSGYFPGLVYISDARPEIRNDSLGHSGNWGVYIENGSTTYPDPTELLNNNTFFDCPSGAVHGP